METMLFDHAESLSIAEMVNFNPSSEVGQEYISDTKSFNLNGFNKEEAYKIRFYLALGCFVWNEYLDNGKTVPDKVNDWYAINTDNASNEGFYSKSFAA